MEGGSTSDQQGENKHGEIFLLRSQLRNINWLEALGKSAFQKKSVRKPGAVLQPDQQRMHLPRHFKIPMDPRAVGWVCAPILPSSQGSPQGDLAPGPQADVAMYACLAAEASLSLEQRWSLE